MNRFSATFARLGGPGAVTWWAFGISTVDRLITVSVQPINNAAPLSARIAATLLAQFAMFAPLVLLRYTFLKDPLKPRPWVALAGFSIADVIRALAVDWLLHVLGGLPLMPELRVFSGFLPTIIPLIVTAYVVNTIRERRRELTALLEVRDQLEQSRAEAESAVERRNEELIQRVRSVLDTELAVLAEQQPANVVAQLQRTATDVVRPLSHELASSFAEREGTHPVPAPVSAGWRLVVGDAFTDKPFRPALTTALISGVWISAIAVFEPARIAMVTTLIMIPVLLAAANVILRRVLPRVGPVSRVVLVAGATLIVGSLIGLILRILAGTWPSATAIAFAATFYVVVVSAGMAVVSGVLAARNTVLEETAVAVSELSEVVSLTRQLQWYHQRALARALHGPVQSAVTAAALRLAEALHRNELTPTLVESIYNDLVATLDVLNSPQAEVTSLASSLERIVGMWEGVCVVTTNVDDAASEIIAQDPVMRACVIDVVTEAVSNAVRHASARSVSVNVLAEVPHIHVAVIDDGHSSTKPRGEGLGSALLNECAREWSLSDTLAGHELRVVLSVREGQLSVAESLTS